MIGSKQHASASMKRFLARTSLFGLIFLLSVSSSFASGPENLITDGDFENPIVTRSQKWDIFPSASGLGWKVEWLEAIPCEANRGQPEAPMLEIHRIGDRPFSGAQYIELDSDCDGKGGKNGQNTPVRIYQEVETTPGVIYTLSYAWSPRPKHSDNAVTVTINGESLAQHSGVGGNDVIWTEETIEFEATTETTVIAFAETGQHADSLGMFLDAIRLTSGETPQEPSEPQEPNEPGESEEPTQPEEPTEPQEPTEPEEPAEPEEPTEPEQPNTPSEALVYYIDNTKKNDGLARIYQVGLDTERGVADLSLVTEIPYDRAHIAVSPDGQRIYAVQNGKVKLGYYDLVAETFVDLGRVKKLKNIVQVAFAPDGTLYVASGSKNLIYTIDIETLTASKVGRVKKPNGKKVNINGADMVF
ncbi:MAG: hypothetical protein AAF629_26245, partial [Chloroflexota bacterium]